MSKKVDPQSEDPHRDFAPGDRVVLGDGVAGEVTAKLDKADGPWAVQFYEVSPDDTPDWYRITVDELTLTS